MRFLLLLQIICLSLFCTCTAVKNNTTVDVIITRMCNIAKTKLLNPSTPEQKKQILNSLKTALVKHLKELQRSQNQDEESKDHIQLIIDGLKFLSVEENYKNLCFDKFGIPHSAWDSTDKQNYNIKNILNTENPLNHAQVQSMINQMGTIIETTIKDTLKEGGTTQDKLEIAERLKKQFIEAFRRTYNKSSMLQDFIHLAEKGMEETIDRLLNKDSHKSVFRSSLVSKDPPVDVQLPIENSAKVSLSSPIPAPKILTSFRTIAPFSGITKDFSCRSILKDTCADLKQLDKVICEYDGTSLDVQQVCDGNIDCPDGSDEKDCIKQIVGKIHSASNIISKMELSHNCFKALTDNSLVSKQGLLLTSLLNSQINFLKKHTKRKEGKKYEKSFNKNINEVAYEIGVIVRTFASSLIEAVCSHEDRLQKDINDAIGLSIDKEFEALRIEAESAWSPSSCRCRNQYCSNMTNCDPQCKRFCYQMHSLRNFNCRSLRKGQDQVPLDVVCDGKPDCLDEADEINCRRDVIKPEVESTRLFDKMINMVKAKTLSTDFIVVRLEMIELQVCLETLKKRTLTHKTTFDPIKVTRNNCFEKLAEIYETILDEGLLKQAQEAIYDFLLTVNENLVTALKCSNLGNKEIFSTERCPCRGSECTQVNCSERCVKICFSNNFLTNYNCSSSPGDVFVPLETICNLKNDCPNGEDEQNCKKDICRLHHLMIIRHKIERFIEKYLGTSVGIALNSWKAKVTAHLLILEKEKNVSRRLLKSAVNEMLADLKHAFGSVETLSSLDAPTRRSQSQIDDDPRLKRFANVAQNVMEMLKLCTL